MIRTDATHKVTLRRPDPESGEIVTVEVTVKKGSHAPSKDPDTDAALEQLWHSGLAVDDDRPAAVEVTDITTGEPVAIDAPVDTAQEG